MTYCACVRDVGFPSAEQQKASKREPHTNAAVVKKNQIPYENRKEHERVEKNGESSSAGEYHTTPRT